MRKKPEPRRDSICITTDEIGGKKKEKPEPQRGSTKSAERPECGYFHPFRVDDCFVLMSPYFIAVLLKLNPFGIVLRDIRHKTKNLITLIENKPSTSETLLPYHNKIR